MVKQFANSGDPAASNLGLHCLPITFLGVSRLQWVKTSMIRIKGVKICRVNDILVCNSYKI